MFISHSTTHFSPEQIDPADNPLHSTLTAFAQPPSTSSTASSSSCSSSPNAIAHTAQASASASARQHQPNQRHQHLQPNAVVAGGGSSSHHLNHNQHQHHHQQHHHSTTTSLPSTSSAADAHLRPVDALGGHAFSTADTRTGSMATSKEEEDSSNAASSDCKSPGQRYVLYSSVDERPAAAVAADTLRCPRNFSAR